MTLTIPRVGGTTRDVPCYNTKVKGLVVHKELECSGWAVTHKNSGKRLCGRLRSRDHAKLAALDFRFADWTCADPDTDFDYPTKSQCVAKVRAIRMMVA